MSKLLFLSTPFLLTRILKVYSWAAFFKKQCKLARGEKLGSIRLNQTELSKALTVEKPASKTPILKAGDSLQI